MLREELNDIINDPDDLSIVHSRRRVFLRKPTTVEGEVDEIICIAEAAWKSRVFKIVNLDR